MTARDAQTVRLLIAPDSFKSSCDARRVTRALARGAQRAAGARGLALELDELPLSDGGEGLIESVQAVMGGEIREAVCTPMTRTPSASETRARWLWHPETKTAIGESAQIVGPHLVQQPSPLRRTARGIAEYMTAMREAGARRIVLGIGGTMTVEGGATVAAGFGAVFRRGDETIDVEDVFDAASATSIRLPRPWADVEVECWCDVLTPLLGPSGGVVTFAPQKGASAADVQALERAVTDWTRRLPGQMPVTPDDPSTGAGGGIPYGVAICTGASLRHGPPALLDLVDFSSAVGRADLVWTGEGRVDATTAEGKLASEVLRRAHSKNRQVVVFAGQVQAGAETALAPSQIVSLSGPDVSVERSMAEAESLLEAAAELWLGNWIEKKSL